MENSTATFDLGTLILTEEPTTNVVVDTPIIDPIEDTIELTDEPKEEVVVTNQNEDSVVVDKTPPDNSTSESYSAKDILGSLGITSYFMEDENGEEVEISIADQDIDLKTAVELITSSHKQEIEDLRANSVSLDDTDNDRKEIIEFIAKGGDPKRLIEYQSDISEVQQYDLEDEKDAEEVIRKYYSYKQDSSKEEVDAVIAGAKAQGNLTSMAETASGKITAHVENLKKAEKDHLDKVIEDNKTALKTFTKELKEKVKAEGFTDKQISKITDFATKVITVKRPDGSEVQTREMDSTYSILRSNPETAHDLAVFLMDKELYLKKKLEEKEIELRKDIIKKVRISKALRSNSSDTTKTVFEQNNNNGGKGTLSLL